MTSAAKETNREGLTYVEWLRAAGRHALSGSTALRSAWLRGEDPTEHRADAPKRFGNDRTGPVRYRAVVRVSGGLKPVHVSPWGTLASAEHAAKNHRAMITHRGWNHVVEIEEEPKRSGKAREETLHEEYVRTKARAAELRREGSDGEAQAYAEQSWLAVKAAEQRHEPWAVEIMLKRYGEKGLTPRRGNSKPFASMMPERDPLHDARYNERFRYPKWNVQPTVLMEPRLAPRVFPEMSRADHLARARTLLRRSEEYEKEWKRTLDQAYKKYGERGHTFISGGFQEHFPEDAKNRIRLLAGGKSKLADAALMHWKAAGKRSGWQGLVADVKG